MFVPARWTDIDRNLLLIVVVIINDYGYICYMFCYIND
jgi:hypothetical protein